MDVSQIQFNHSIFFLNALSAFALNISIFLVIGRTGAVTIRVAGVLKDWILIALSTIIFPESVITSLNIIGYAVGNYFSFFCIWNNMSILYSASLLLVVLVCMVCIVALSGVVLYNYLKMKDVKANQLPVDNNPDRSTKVSMSFLLLVLYFFSIFVWYSLNHTVTLIEGGSLKMITVVPSFPLTTMFAP